MSSPDPTLPAHESEDECESATYIKGKGKKHTALYELLEIEPDATPKQIRKAFLKMSLKYHPDRNPDGAIQFQEMYKAYAALSDTEKRKRYDRTGEVDDEGGDVEDGLLSAQLTEQDIEDFAREYKNSNEEEEDLLAIYLASEGDLEEIMITVILAEIEDEERFISLIMKHIEAGDVPAFPRFLEAAKSSSAREKRRRKAEKEAREAEEHAKELGLGDSMTDLRSAIISRSTTRGSSFLADLEAKYCTPSTNSNGNGKSKSKGKKSRPKLKSKATKSKSRKTE